MHANLLRTSRFSPGALLLAGLIALLMQSGEQAVRGQEPPEWKNFTYQDSSACKDCHSSPKKDSLEKGNLQLVLLTEYVIWKTHDKHAQAYAVLLGTRGKEIEKALDLTDSDGKHIAVTDPRAGCLGCHAMYNLSKSNELKAGGKGLNPEDGVSCGGCHGPSSEWGGPMHYAEKWRKTPATEKEAHGLRDVRDPTKRAELCMSCHIGNPDEGKVATHAMFAAGHPPLPPFEIASFSRNEPQHWRDAPDVPYLKDKFNDPTAIAAYDLQGGHYTRSRFALIGQVVAVRQTMKLAQERAARTAADPGWTWPEIYMDKDNLKADKEGQEKAAHARWPEVAMAHSDCYACHHDLRVPGFRTTRGFGYLVPGMDPSLVKGQRVVPGRPVVRTWPLASLKAAAEWRHQVGDWMPALHKDLAALTVATNARPFGDPVEINSATCKLVNWCDGVIKDLHDNPTWDKAAELRLFAEVARLTEDQKGYDYLADYETARQLASLLRVIYRDLGDELPEARRKAIEPVLEGFVEKLDLEPYTNRMKRFELLVDVVRKIAKPDGGDVKRFDDGAKAFAAYLEKGIGDQKQLEEFASRQNLFLTTVRDSVGSREFTAALIDPSVADVLQKFSHQEQEKLLNCLADYDARWFRAEMAKVAAALK